NLARPGSFTRDRMDRLYQAHRQEVLITITDQFPGAEATSLGAGVFLTRAGASATLSIAAVRIPKGFDVPAVIPAEYRPPSFVYGTLSPNRSDTEVRPIEITSTGRVRIYGNEADE